MDSAQIFTFSNAALVSLARKLRADYQSTGPWPHTVIDEFLPTDVAELLVECFPSPDDEAWLDWRKRDPVHQPKKQGIGQASNLEGASPYLQSGTKYICPLFRSQAGRKAFTLQTVPAREEGKEDRRLAKASGFSFHAGVAAQARRTRRLERPCWYIAQKEVGYLDA